MFFFIILGIAYIFTQFTFPLEYLIQFFIFWTSVQKAHNWVWILFAALLSRNDLSLRTMKDITCDAIVGLFRSNQYLPTREKFQNLLRVIQNDLLRHVFFGGKNKTMEFWPICKKCTPING